MQIHDYKGLAPGKCRQNGTIDNCRSSLFNLLEQNYRYRSSIMLPVTGCDRTMTTKKVRGIVLKHFDHKGLTIQKLSGGENK
jgi:hypothetical protein